MWKTTFKEMFSFLFDNPVIFLIILSNYALMFLFAPLIGFVASWFIATFYLVGIHGSINTLWEDLKRFAKWGFVISLVMYPLYILVGLISYYIYNFLVFKFHISFGGLMLFTLLYSLLLSAIIHPVYSLLFASTNLEGIKKNLKKVKLLFTSKEGFETLLLLWGFIFLTLLTGLIKFIHATVGLFSVVATFWLTYYTFLAVKVLKKNKLKEV